MLIQSPVEHENLQTTLFLHSENFWELLVQWFELFLVNNKPKVFVWIIKWYVLVNYIFNGFFIASGLGGSGSDGVDWWHLFLFISRCCLFLNYKIKCPHRYKIDSYKTRINYDKIITSDTLFYKELSNMKHQQLFL